MAAIRVGVVGLGVGERHLATYSALPDVEVVAICDIDPARLEEVGERFDVGVRSTDHRAVTEHPEIDVVSICSYDDVHVEQAISAFRTGKHVFVEKPVALNRSDAAALLGAQQESGRLISSNLILRASPRFIELKRWIQDGRLGDVFAIEGDYLHQILWKLTEGWRGAMDFYCVTYGGGIHLIDLMRWLLEDEVAEVAAMGNQMLTAGTQYRYPDSIFTLLRFSGGAIGKSLTTLGPQRPKFHSLNVYGTTHTFVNDTPNAWLYPSDDPDDAIEVTSAYPGMEKGDLLPDFIEAIRSGHEPEVGARDVFRVMDVCFASWEALQQQRTIKVDYLL